MILLDVFELSDVKSSVAILNQFRRSLDNAFPTLFGNNEYIQQPRQKPRKDSNEAHNNKIAITTTPAYKSFAANNMVVTTEIITPIRAANTLGALSTILGGSFNPETTPLAKVANRLYLGFKKARIIKSIDKNPVIILVLIYNKN